MRDMLNCRFIQATVYCVLVSDLREYFRGFLVKFQNSSPPKLNFGILNNEFYQGPGRSFSFVYNNIVFVKYKDFLRLSLFKRVQNLKFPRRAFGAPEVEKQCIQRGLGVIGI